MTRKNLSNACTEQMNAKQFENYISDPIDNGDLAAARCRLYWILVPRHTFVCKIPSTFVVQKLMK